MSSASFRGGRLRSAVRARSLALSGLFLTIVAATPALAKDPVIVKLAVRGMVCSFCAQGMEKKLADLPGLDANAFRDGVLVEISSQQATLQFTPGAPIPFAEIATRVEAGGYELQEIRLDARGVQATPDRGVLRAVSPPQRFALATEAAPDLSGPVPLRIAPEAATDHRPGDVVPAELAR